MVILVKTVLGKLYAGFQVVYRTNLYKLLLMYKSLRWYWCKIDVLIRLQDIYLTLNVEEAAFSYTTTNGINILMILNTPRYNVN